MNVIRNKRAEVLDSINAAYDISICVITYNKVDFIDEAIRSVFMQKTNCSYEIVIGDNNSTDGTQNILREYWNRSPEKFTIIFNNENLGLTTNIYNTMSKSKGKYIIILYGDDYWISENKLQIQYDFLEHNSNYNGVTSAIEFRYNKENKPFKIVPCKKMRNTTCSLKKYMNGFDFPLAGMMFRNNIFSNEQKHFEKMIKASLFIDDLSFCILFLMIGDVFILPEATGVYRCFHKEENINNFNSVNSIKKRVEMSIQLCNCLDSLTNNKLDFSMRYGLVLASAWYAILKRKLSLQDYKEIIQMLQPQYRKKHSKLLWKGIYRKVTLR